MKRVRIATAFLFACLSVASDSVPVGTGTWTAMGPRPAANGSTSYVELTSGRVTSIAADPSDSKTLYAGAAGGGVWRTVDGGQTWTPVTDTQASLFIGAVAVAPSNSKVIYAGTGEANNGPSKELRELRYNIFSGRGILRSGDGGATWSLLGGSTFTRRTISRLVVAPNNENVVYAAVGARASDGLDGNTGVWKSSDGGATWTNTTQKISTTTPVSDLAIDPSNSQLLYAAFGDPAGNSANGVYRTTDGGATWTVVNLGGTQSRYGRIALALSNGTPQTIFASMSQASVTSNSLYGVFRSTNGGSTWTRLAISVNDKYCAEFGAVSNILAIAGDYHQAIAVDPKNPSRVYLAGLCIIGSSDGGNNWTLLGDGEASGPHHDHHALAFDARGLLLDGNDGGIWRLDDPAAVTWSNLNAGLGITQFQGLALHPTDANIVVGGTQDTGTVVFANSTQWTRSQRGDGGATIIDPSRPARVYQVAEEDSYIFSRSLDGGKTFTLTRAVAPDLDTETRLWYFPMVVDPNNGARLVIGTYRLWLSSDAGSTWNVAATAGQGEWSTTDPVTAIAFAPSDSTAVYAAAGGHLIASNDFNSGSPTWRNRDLPDVQPISAIAVSASDANSLCIARNLYGTGLVFCSSNGGQTWRAATGDLPQAPVLSLLMDSRTTPATLYAGTIAGVRYSIDSGAHWLPLGAGLPNAAVPVLALQGRLLAAGTHGRGAWEMLLPDASTATPQISAGGVVIHAGVSPIASPGSLMDLYGTNLSTSTGTAQAGTLPNILANSQISVNGTAAPLIYMSPTQAIFQVPYEVAPGAASVKVTSGGNTSAAATITVQQAAPFILTYGNNRAVVQNADFSINGTGAGASPGSAVVAYLMGSGPLDHPVATGVPTPDSPLAQEVLPTVVTVGGTKAALIFAGLTPRFAGLVQVNFQVPNLPPGDYPLQVSIGGSASNQPLFTVSK